MNVLLAWSIVVATICLLMVLLAFRLPLSWRKERGARALLIAISAPIIAVLIIHLLGMAWGTVGLLVIAVGVAFCIQQRFVLMSAAAVWRRLGPYLHTRLQSAAWLEYFSLASGSHDHTVFTRRDELTGFILGSPLLKPDEARMMTAVLGYETKQVSSFMRPLERVVTVARDDVIGPLLLDELHQSHQPAFPVTDDSGNIVGIVSYESLMNASHHDISIASLMQAQVLRVSPQADIGEVLQAMFRGTSWLAVVHSGEDIGIILLSDIIDYLFGKPGR